MIDRTKLIYNKDLANTLIIKWRMQDWCNYRCSYCIRQKEDLTQQADMSKLIDIASTINSFILSQNKRVKLTLVGGEVTFLDLKTIFDVLTKNVNTRTSICILTNFSNNIDYYNDLIDYTKKHNILLSFQCSLHDEYVTVNDFVSKVNKLQTKHKSIEFVSTKDNKHKVEELVKLCEAFGILVKLDNSVFEKTTEASSNLQAYSEKRFVKVLESGKTNYVSKADLQTNFLNVNRFISKNWYCYNNSIVINTDGTIRYKSCIADKLQDNLKLNEPIIKCPNLYCGLCGVQALARSKQDLIALLEEKKIEQIDI